MPTPFIVALGLVILSVFCIADFKSHVIVPGSKAAYWTVLGLFLGLNWALYITLCGLVLQEPMLAELLIGKKAQTLGTSVALLALAVAHFGTGAAPLPFGAKNQSIYDRLLRAFQTIFRINVIDEDGIETILSQMSKKTDANFENLEQLHDRFGDDARWCLRARDWSDLQLKKELLDEELETLKPLQEQVGAPRTNKRKVVKEIQARRKTIDQKLNEGLSRYVEALIFENRGNQEALKQIIRAVGIEAMPDLQQQVPNIPYRVTILCGLFGIAVGLIATNFGKNQTHQLWVLWVSFAAFAVFGTIFSFVGRTRRQVKSFAEAILIGMLAGITGQGIFRYFAMELLWSVPFRLESLILGGLFGAFAGFAIHAYRLKARSVIWQQLRRDWVAISASYGLFAVLGALGTTGIVYLLPTELGFFEFLNEGGRLIFVPCFGAIFISAAALATGVIHREVPPAQSPAPGE